MDAIQSAIAKKEILDSLRPIDPEHEQRIMQKFRLDWNYHSNHIEGNSLSYGETKALLLFNITAQGKPLKDHFEIKGHNEAIDWVLDVIKDKRELTESFIRQLHELLLKEPYMSDAVTPDGKPTKKRIEIGKYKTHPNHVKTVTGEIFYFATPEETPAKMNDLLSWYHDQRKTESLNPILLAADFHYKFIRIHPFDDGNGRIARILMNFILMQYNYPPVIIKTEDKENYYRALQQADAGIITPFIEYIAGNLDHSLDIMIAGAQGESIEDPDDIEKELLLLEQEINNTNKHVIVQRKNEIVIHQINTSISLVIQHFISECDKLAAYYRSVNIGYSIDDFDGAYFRNQSLQWNIDMLMGTNETFVEFHKLNFFCIYYTFLPLPNKSTKIDIDHYRNEITIEFFAISYHLSNSLGDKIVKNYDEQLTEEEVNRIIKREILKHMRFIAKTKQDAENYDDLPF